MPYSFRACRVRTRRYPDVRSSYRTQHNSPKLGSKGVRSIRRYLVRPHDAWLRDVMAKPIACNAVPNAIVATRPFLRCDDVSGLSLRSWYHVVVSIANKKATLGWHSSSDKLGHHGIGAVSGSFISISACCLASDRYAWNISSPVN